jgi:hypothetical protein
VELEDPESLDDDRSSPLQAPSPLTHLPLPENWTKKCGFMAGLGLLPVSPEHKKGETMDIWDLRWFGTALEFKDMKIDFALSADGAL